MTKEIKFHLLRHLHEIYPLPFLAHYKGGPGYDLFKPPHYDSLALHRGLKALLVEGSITLLRPRLYVAKGWEPRDLLHYLIEQNPHRSFKKLRSLAKKEGIGSPEVFAECFSQLVQSGTIYPLRVSAAHVENWMPTCRAPRVHPDLRHTAP